MTLSLPSAPRRRTALRVRLLGFPVGIDVSFLVVLAFLGYGALSRGVSYLVVWIAVAAVAVLVHELGHAVAARYAGAHPSIELYGFGGVTTFENPPGGLSRARSVVISIAGPATGVVLGCLLLLLRRQAGLGAGGGIGAGNGTLAAYAVEAGVFVTLGWGLLNLLPILPLDGGNVLAALLPGPPQRQYRLAAAVSVAVAAIAGGLALLGGWIYPAILAGWFAIGNIAALRPDRPAPALTAEQLQRRAQDSRGVAWLLDQGRIPEARHLAQSAPAGVDPECLARLQAL
ncbi:MAG: M50 family metallopeptidase [Actinomycetota bacterium]|nr:M50 family metallopeptidase [Actinomycetota bacterium]